MVEHTPASARTTVLVIDGDRAVRDSLKFLLELEGFPVVTYADGAALLKADDLPDDACLVVDQVMPGMSGLETIDAVRHRGGPYSAVLMVSHLTARVQEGAAMRGIAVVEKPFMERMLIEAISNVIGRRA